MGEKGRNKTWKQEQKKQFGERLKWAQQRAGYRRSSDVIRKLEKNSGTVARTYYSHTAGERVPDDDEVIDTYCDLFQISREFLLFGFGPELSEYTDSPNSDVQGSVNPDEIANKVNASQFQPVSYIPLLRASDIRHFVTGTGDPAMMAGERLPVARHIVAGARAFAYELPKNDRSMTGEGQFSFHPSTILTIDPDRAIMPDDFALVWPTGWPEPTLRQLKSPWPLMPLEPRYPFELNALNPAFETISVASADDCQILGRLVSASQQF